MAEDGLQPVLLGLEIVADDVIVDDPGNVYPQVGEAVQHGPYHLVVFLVEDPPGDAAMGPDELRHGIFLEHLLELVEMFVFVVDADRGAVLMEQDGQAAPGAQLVDVMQGGVVDPGRLLVGQVGQVVVAAEDLPDAPPEGVFLQHPLGVAIGVSVGGVEAA